MRLDIRIPIGLLFLLFGLLLTLFGLVGNQQIYARSLGLNVNLGWGLVLMGFGAVMFTFGRRGSRRLAAAKPAGGNTGTGPGKNER